MRLTPLELLSRLNASYWFVPLLVTAAGVALALTLLLLDRRLGLGPDAPLALLRPNSAEGARSLLSAVIGAMITALSVTFSVTVVALTVAAQHFGPRVLNTFVSHTSAQVVLGTFMATFVYAVLVLGGITGTGDDAEIPEIAVTGAVLLVIVSVGALIFYVHHVSTSLQIGNLTREIAGDFHHALEWTRHPPERLGPGGDRPHPDAPPDARPIVAAETGYVQRLDYEALVEAAAARDVVLWMRREPGGFVVSGTPLAVAAPADRCDAALEQDVRHASVMGPDRTLWQDPEFAIKQLVEVALRALSPGVNEPFTATTCIDRLTQALAWIATSPLTASSWCDNGNVPRVYSRPQRFETLLRASHDPIRIFAGPNPAIYARLLDSVSELAFVAGRPEDRQALRQQADVIRRAADAQLTDTDDRAFVAAHYARALDNLPAV